LIVAVIYFVGQILFVAVPVSVPGTCSASFICCLHHQSPASSLSAALSSASPEVSLRLRAWVGAVILISVGVRRRLSRTPLNKRLKLPARFCCGSLPFVKLLVGAAA